MVPDLFRAILASSKGSTMAAILKIISLILWAIDYAKKNPKKTTAATLGSGVVAMGLYGGSGVPNNPPATFHGGNSKNVTSATDGQVWTYDSADGKWNPEAGGGGSGLTIDGTMTDGDSVSYDATDSVYIPERQKQNVKNFIGGIRAAGSSLQTTGTVSASSTSMTVAAGWDGLEGHGISVLGAGADHGLSTPTAPLVMHQTQRQSVVLPNSNTWETAVTFTASTSTNLITTSQPLTIANGIGVIFSNQGGALPTYVTTTAFTENTAGAHFLRTVTTTTFSVHPSAGDAIANTNAYDIDGTGSGTHYLQVVGSTTNTYKIRALSGNGGSTAESSAGSTTTASATLDGVTENLLVWPVVTNAQGYVVYNSTSDYPLTAVNGTWNCKVLVADAAGYTNLEVGDIGRTIVRGTSDGIILGFDNATRSIVIDPTDVDADTFPAVATLSWSITGGTGAGTQTAAATNQVYWRDRGESISATPYKRFCRRDSAEMYVGELMFYPSTSSGKFYRVYRIYGDRLTASSAPSYNTALGDFTTDGNVVLRREDPVFPSTTTGAAIFDPLRTSIAAVSGTTVTLTDAATTSVTSQKVFHDDLTAVQSHQAAVNSSSGKCNTLFFPRGDYPLMAGKIVTGTGQDTRWGSPTGGGSNQYALFNISGRQTWEFDSDARMTFLFTDVGGNISTSGNPTNLSVWRLSTSEPVVKGGKLVIATAGEPIFEKAERGSSSGYNNLFFGIVNSSTSTPRIDGPKFDCVEFHGWPLVLSMNGSRGYGQAEEWRNCYISYGGADGDNTFYTKGGVWEDCTIIGIRWTRSYTWYQDAEVNPITQGMTILGGYFKNIRKESVRFRGDQNYLGRNFIFEDCSRIYCTDGPIGVTIENGNLYRTNIELNGADNVMLSKLTIEDGFIQVPAGSDNVRISDVHVFTPAAGPAWIPSGSSLLAVAGGTDLKVSNSTFECLHSSGGTDVRGFGISGGSDEIEVVNSTFKGSRDWGVIWSTFTGNLKTANCVFTGNGGPEACLLSLGSTGTWTSTSDTFEANTGANEIAFNGGGRIELINPTFTGKLSVEAGITGPFIIRGGRSTSSTAAAIVEPSVLIEGHNFAVAPTLTGATLNLRNNTVADANSVTPSALAIGVTNDYALPVTSQVHLDPNASNSTITSFVARADGTEVTIICTDAGAATLTIDSSAATGTAANKIMCPGDTDIVMSSGERIVIKYDATTSLWYVIGGQYVAMDWQGGAMRLWQQGEQFNQPATRQWALAA